MKIFKHQRRFLATKMQINGMLIVIEAIYYVYK